MTRQPNRAGFSLLGVIVVLAVLAILAAVITPMYFRQLMEARERATTAELLQIEEGLVAFFEDLGRFPTDAEGLSALVVDPGLTGWQGPYINLEHEEPIAQVSTDAWNLGYVYDLYPVTVPADTATVLITSGGRNRLVDAGSLGNTWTIDGTDDDLQALVTALRVNREKSTASSVEQEILGKAAQAYFRDHQAYPTNLSQLSDNYLDPGLGSDALNDQWNRSYVWDADNSVVPPTLTISSLGPDGLSGGGDDVDLTLNSVLPGRRNSYYELAINQAVVTAETGTELTGDWTADRSDFRLASVLETDGWGNPYEEQMSTRTILSGGPDADYFTPDDNIPPGIVPDDVVPEGGGIEYEDESGETDGKKCDTVVFEMTNTTSGPITLTNLTLTWTGPTAWFKKIEVDDEDVVEQDKPQVGSGVTAEFEDSVTMQPGETFEVVIGIFRDKEWEGGKKVNMGGTTFTVELSDGSTFTFTVPPC
jgi:general secretion pathway protein G